MSTSQGRGRPARGAALLAKRSADKAVLARLARQQERSDLAAILAGPHGDAFRALRSCLRGLAPADGRHLVAWVEASPLRRADDRIRAAALREISAAIGRVKARAGLADDDPLPGQPESARQACARLLRERLP